MKILLTIFGTIYLFLFFFSKVTINHSQNVTIWERADVCCAGAAILTLLVGFPVLGVMYLFGEIL